MGFYAILLHYPEDGVDDNAPTAILRNMQSTIR